MIFSNLHVKEGFENIGWMKQASSGTEVQRQRQNSLSYLLQARARGYPAYTDKIGESILVILRIREKILMVV